MKKVMTCLYVHKSNRWELFNYKRIDIDREHMEHIINSMEGFFNYQVIKYDYKKRTLSLIQSPDFDTANEPTVGRSIIFDLSIGKDLTDTPKKQIKARTKNPQIYHNKWMFVGSSYSGFDIEKAKQRTKEWNLIPNLNKSKIGNRDYWEQLLIENNMEV